MLTKLGIDPNVGMSFSRKEPGGRGAFLPRGYLVDNAHTHTWTIVENRTTIAQRNDSMTPPVPETSSVATGTIHLGHALADTASADLAVVGSGALAVTVATLCRRIQIKR